MLKPKRKETFQKLRLLAVILTAGVILTGCQTPRISVSKEQLENIKPFNLVTNSVDDPTISYYSSTDAIAMQMGYQGGAIGGALTYLIISDKRSREITKRQDMLGEFWDEISGLDLDACLEESAVNWNKSQNQEWFGSIELVQDEKVVKNHIPQGSAPSIQLLAGMEFAMNLSYVSFSAEYAAYWSNSEQLSSKINSIVLSPSLSIDPESNATQWNDSISNPKEFVTQGYKDLIELLERDLQLPSYFLLGEQPRLTVWGVSGRLIDYEEGKRIILRNWDEGMYSLPVPKIIYKEVEIITIEKSPQDEHEDLSLILAALLENEGFEVRIVDNREGYEDSDLYIKIFGDWRWEFRTYLRSASISLIDPSNNKTIGYGSASSGSETQMFIDPPEEVILNCWEDAYELDLKDEIERLMKNNFSHQISSSPLGE